MLKRLSKFTWQLLKEEDGPTAVEYAVMIMMILLVCLVAIQTIGLETAESFNDSSEQIADAFN